MNGTKEKLYVSVLYLIFPLVISIVVWFTIPNLDASFFSNTSVTQSLSAASTIALIQFLGALRDFIPLFITALLVIGLFSAAWNTRLNYLNLKNYLGKKKVLLQVILPGESEQTIKSMEQVLSFIHLGSGESDWYSRFIKGNTRPEISLELISSEGRTNVYIRAQENLSTIISSAIYAHYPEAAVNIVPDYAEQFLFNDKVHMWAFEFDVEDKNELPIKSYVDYKIEREYDEASVDPMNFLFDFMGSMKQGQHIWLQFYVRTNKFPRRKVLNPFSADYTTKVKVTDKLSEKAREIYEEGSQRSAQSTDGKSAFITLSEEENAVLKAIERKQSKPLFDVGIRVVYMDTADSPRIGEVAPGITGIFKTLSGGKYNTVIPTRGWIPFDFSWEETKSIIAELRQEFFHYSRLRLFHLLPAKFFAREYRPEFVLSAEELATVFHFPSKLTKTPTIARTQSKVESAPINLPG